MMMMSTCSLASVLDLRRTNRLFNAHTNRYSIHTCGHTVLGEQTRRDELSFQFKPNATK